MAIVVEPDANQDSTNLRLWPAIAIVALMWVAMKGSQLLTSDVMLQFMCAFFSPLVALALTVLWWLFASRVSWKERLIGLAICGALVGIALVFAHKGTRDISMFMFAPWMLTAIVALLLLGIRLPWNLRRCLPILAVLVTAIVGLSLRFEGADGSFKNPKFSLRWNPTREETFLSKASAAQPEALAFELQLPLSPSNTDWPEFRGTARDGHLSGVTFPTDWKASPPREIWRREIGPGWSSFTVVGEFIFTQEQRGPREVVVAYNAMSGEPLWINEVDARFEETIGGPGPRATPTYHQGKLYSQGAGGKVLCINASAGETLWERDLLEDTPAENAPVWGFSSSPLVFEEYVITYSGAGKGKSVVAYQREDGAIAWTSGDSTHGYSSPQLSTIDGVQQILILSNAGVAGFQPEDGTQLWKHDWPLEKFGPQANRVVQPLVLGNDVLLGTFYGLGTRRITVTHENDEWTTEEQWTSRHMKPYFNDYVEHKAISTVSTTKSSRASI